MSPLTEPSSSACALTPLAVSVPLTVPADRSPSIETPDSVTSPEMLFAASTFGVSVVVTLPLTVSARTAATLQKNLAVIDQAISESRAAVRSQPSSEPAQQSLLENFKTKIGLLQDTVALINEMRKGNEAGAARIVAGLKNKGN